MLQEDGERGEEESAFEQLSVQRKRTEFGLIQTTREGERNSDTHREQEHREHEIDPRDAGHRRIEDVRRWRKLRVVHPRWQHLVGDDAGKHHHQDGEAT